MPRFPTFARWPFAASLLLVLVLAGGCATYSDKMKAARETASSGDYAGGVNAIDKILKVDEPDAMPEEWGDEAALAILERATLKQALEHFATSAIDFQAADKELDFIDLSGDTAGEIGRYIYSDSARKYSASPTEKLSINAFNMLNYLAQYDLAGARVEAKRFTTMRNYLKDFDPESAHGVFGSYLAGFTFEKLGDATSALRYYDEVLQFRELKSLKAPVARLARESNYRGLKLKSFLAGTDTATSAANENPTEILVVVSTGRVPHKIPERMPIGAAIGAAGTFITGDIKVLGYTATKFIIYPKLVPADTSFGRASLKIDGRKIPMELASNIGAEIKQEYDAMFPQIIGAALSRLIVRAAAAEGARAAGKQSGGDNAELVGFLAALATEGLMSAADKPDTRSWIFLPNSVYIHRQTVPPGSHQISIDLQGAMPSSGESHQMTVDLKSGESAVLVVTAPR